MSSCKNEGESTSQDWLKKLPDPGTGSSKKSSFICSAKPWFLEAIVAISLCAAFYFQMRGSSMAFIQGGDNLNYWAFSACSLQNFHLDDMSPVWCGRFLGMICSGYWLDFWDPHHTLKQYSSIFSLYHTCWLAIIFLVVSLSLKHSLLVNLGIFAGLIYYFSPAAGWYFYPWDMPATLFFTLSVLFYEQKKFGMMSLSILIGCFFKETVLVSSLLILFHGDWKPRRRLFVFLLLLIAYGVGKKIFLAEWHLHHAVFSMNNAQKLKDLFATNILEWNLRFVFIPKLNNILFVNAGTLVAVLCLCWGRIQRPYTFTILAFALAMSVFGAYNEFRVFMQILPPSLMLLSLKWQDFSAGASLTQENEPARQDTAQETDTPWLVRPTNAWLTPLTLAVVICAGTLTLYQLQRMIQLGTPEHQVKTFERLTAQAKQGNIQAQFQLAKRYQVGEGTLKNPEEAIRWYLQAAKHRPISAPEIIFAQENLAAIYLNKQDQISAYTWLKIATDSGSERTPNLFKEYVTTLNADTLKAGEEEFQNINNSYNTNKP